MSILITCLICHKRFLTYRHLVKSGRKKYCSFVCRNDALSQNITGKKFNKLTAISCTKSDKRWQKWLFRCECGNEKVLIKSLVVRGHTKSCGCLSKFHGLWNTRFYYIWHYMRQRCSNSNNNAYKFYGGRGVNVCERWGHFKNFQEDMYKSYLYHVKKFGEKETTIDRINSDDNYKLNNCRWATRKEQHENSRHHNQFTPQNKRVTTIFV